MKTIERFIVCAALLAFLAFGCKDEAEAIPRSTNYINLDEAGGIEIVDCTFEFTEPNEPDEQAYLKLDFVDAGFYDEPNDFDFATKVIEGQTFYDTREGIEPNKRMWIFDGDNFRRIDDIEPNEPEDYEDFAVSNSLLEDFGKQIDWGEMVTYSITCNKCNKDLSPYEYVTPNAHQCGVEPKPLLEMLIPTWPDYIELEKDLVIEYEYETVLEEYTGPGDVPGTVRTKPAMGTVQYDFPKGTKIYYKDKEE